MDPDGLETTSKLGAAFGAAAGGILAGLVALGAVIVKFWTSTKDAFRQEGAKDSSADEYKDLLTYMRSELERLTQETTRLREENVAQAKLISELIADNTRLHQEISQLKSALAKSDVPDGRPLLPPT